jgi:opacity protein-like surface antigen
MNKSALAVAAFLALSAPASAATWLVTEENTGGIKGAQGSWTVKTEGGKISGDASMQMDNGSTLTYKVEGTAEGTNYTITFSDRTDGKKNCVWKGHPPSSGGQQARGLIGYAECDGGKLIVRASMAE